MCGIIGYIGKQNSQKILLTGLELLEYRGYDSAGIAVLDQKQNIQICKAPGKLQELKNKLSKNPLSGYCGIGHTRWATHGAPSLENSHPHCYKNIILVHNGIIENAHKIRLALENQKHNFASQTDSEVVAHLLDKLLAQKLEPLKALSLVCESLSGAYALAIMIRTEPEKIYFAKFGSPLVIAQSNKNQNFIASDATALINFEPNVYALKDGEIGYMTQDKIKLFDLCLEEKNIFFEKLKLSRERAQKNSHKFFMHKEIFEQPQALQQTFLGKITNNKLDISGFDLNFEKLKHMQNIHIVGCGSAYYAGLAVQSQLEDFSQTPVRVEVASEYRYKSLIINNNTLVIAISQSGETADTLAATKKALDMGASCISICNNLGSALTRMCEPSLGNLYLRVGPEISVASTKAFTGQICLLKLFTYAFAKFSNNLTSSQEQNFIRDIKNLAQNLNNILTQENKIRLIAQKLINSPRMLFLGRGDMCAMAYEGALKMKELSYISAEGYPAGELKHGPIATIDPNMPAVVIFGFDNLQEKTLSNLEEIKARGAKIISIAPANSNHIQQESDFFIKIENSNSEFYPVFTTIVLQLLAYHVADLKNLDIDKPRNLAKSVTVE